MKVNSPSYTNSATHSDADHGVRSRTGAQASGSFNGHAVSHARADGASASRSIGRAARAVKRLAQRLMPGGRAGQRNPSPAPVALNIPRDYGWPLGLMESQRLATLHPDDAYEQAFATHEARVGEQVAESAKQRFGHTHVDDDTLREQLHAWLNGEGAGSDDADVKYAHDATGESGRWSEAEHSPSASPGAHSYGSMSPRFDESPHMAEHDGSSAYSSPASLHSQASHESEIQAVHEHDAAATATRPSGEATTSGTRHVRFAPKVQVRTFEEGAAHGDGTAPLHTLDRTAVKPRKHAPDSPEYSELTRQRSINQAAWDTVVKMKSPGVDENDRKLTADMFKRNEIRFDIRRHYKIAEADAPQVMAVAKELHRATGPMPARSFTGKVKNLVRALVPQNRPEEAGLIRIPGPDLRDPAALNGEQE